MERDSPQQISNLSELEVLKGRLEQQEAAKLKAEQIVSTLSRIKAREKATRRRVSTRDDSLVVSSGDRKSYLSPNSAVKEKSNLLRRKLEEDRAKVESQRGSENLDKVNEVVETIKAQLEDRGKLVQELLLNAQQQQIHHSLLKVNVDDEKSENESPSEPVIPDEIKQKIADLEAKIIDLQENLKEKDEVISARTQAITLLSEDMSRKSKTTLDTLEETQEQMRQMQNNFILIEDKMKQEHQRLKEEAEDRKNRCLQAEKNLRIVEAARFDLSTRVAELQEKVVGLQTKNIELEKSISEAETKQNELQSALDAAKNTSVKMKAQFKIKMKALEEERDQYKKMADDGNALTSLQERIAELEEEKGNLQLSLVDFDEQQEQCHLLKERVAELEQKLLQQGDDLDSHVKAMSKLELEKLDLIQVVQERNSLLSDKDLLIDQLQQQLTEIEQLKVSAEMRSIELEEKLDGFIRDKRSIDSENETDVLNMRQQLSIQEETINELKTKLLSRQTELVQGGGDGNDLRDMSSELEEWKQKYFCLETRYNEVNDMYKSVENRVEEAEKQNELIVSECNSLKATIVHLQSVVNQNSSQVVDQGTTCLALTEEPIGRSSDSDHEKDFEINRLREELSSATVELHRLSTALDNMKITSQQIDELNKQIVEKDKALINVNNELEKRSRKLSDYKKFHKLKSEDVLRVSHELESVSTSYQEKIVELEGEIAKAREKEAELFKEIKDLKENLQNNQAAPSDQTQKIKKLVATLKLKAKACKDLEAKLEEKDKSLRDKDIFIEELVTKENNYLIKISELDSKCSELLSVTDFRPPEQEQVSVMASKVESLIIERDNQNSKILDQEQLICQLENEIKLIKEDRDHAFSEMEKIQENEFSKNDEMLRNFETQVSESRTEIESLQGQLIDAVTQVKQAWAKLQEKEAYIESLETELNRAQEKLRSIESSSDEVTRDLREKTEILGNRLNKAEEINAELQKYKVEVEQRFIFSDQSEMLLKKSLTDKTNESEELKQSINELNNRLEWFEGENNNLKNYITNLQNEISNLNYVQDSYNQSLQEIEKLNCDIKSMKLSNERAIAELNEREKLAVESLENELKSLADKCSTIENERNHLSKEYENVHSENQLLKEEIDKFKNDFESKYSFLESERNHFEMLYSKLKSEINVNEEKLGAISENKNKEIEDIMNQQRLLVERLHTEFKQKEDNYFAKIHEQEDYNLKLQQSLQTIESNAEALKGKLIEVGSELASSKEELIALKNDQERTLHLKNELEKIKEDYNTQLEGERKRVKDLEVELLREKARKEIDIVVKEAEIKVDSMSQAQVIESNPPLFKFSESDQDDFSKSFGIVPESSINQDEEPPMVRQSEVKDVHELTRQLNFVLEENERLSAIVSSYDTNKQSVEAEIIPNVETYSLGIPSRIENKDEEDGWGWGGEEVGLMEQEVSALTSASSNQARQSSQLIDDRISFLEQKLLETEAENARLSEELKASQIRCTKLVKKAKELKAKSDDLERGTREKSIGFEDLDFAMQEELREQIVKLEKNLQEAMNENKNWKTEKENYLRRIDTLTSGNERLVEMKERQDIELSIFEKQNSDLKQQILAFEWKVEELTEDHDRLTKIITEMEEKINNLASENEHLIKIVGDMKDQQKGLVVPSQQQVSIQESNQNPMFTMFHDESSKNQQKTGDVYDSLTMQNFEQLSHEKNEIMINNNELKLKVDVLNAKINELDSENHDLRNKIDTYKKSSDSEMKKFLRLVNDYELLQQTCTTDEEKLQMYEMKLEELERENRNLTESCALLQTTVTGLNDLKEQLQNEYDDLLKKFNFISNELEEVKKERDNLIIKFREINEENDSKVTSEPSGSAVMFRGFADDSSDNDPFNISQDVQKQEFDLPKYKSWDNIEQTKNVVTNNVQELKEQVTSLTTLLQEKEMELEISKQSLDNIKLESENLRDVWSKKYEDLKMELTKNYDDLKTEQTKECKKYEDIQLEQSNVCTDNLGVYEDVLNAAEQKFKDSILLKDEEIAHLTCELSSKEQQLINLKKEISTLTSNEEELVKIIENYKSESEQQWRTIHELREECVKLQEQLNQKEAQNLPVTNVVDKNEEVVEPQKETVTSHDSAAIPSNILYDNQHQINIDEQVSKFKEMIKQRDIEIERLLQALGEAEERLIKIEETRLSSEEVHGLKLKLDEALYTLHLRDVRCEELTLELMQLLEERDTLQLRLSTAIRMNEEMRRKATPIVTSVPIEPVISTTNNSSSCTTRTSSIEHNPSSSDQETTQSDSESGRLDRLNEKLGELHTIGYQRDLSLHQDRIRRHNEQMHLYSPASSPTSLPHQSSSLPDAHISISNEDSNTSGGFFSWIFGGNG